MFFDIDLLLLQKFRVILFPIANKTAEIEDRDREESILRQIPYPYLLFLSYPKTDTILFPTKVINSGQILPKKGENDAPLLQSFNFAQQIAIKRPLHPLISMAIIPSRISN